MLSLSETRDSRYLLFHGLVDAGFELGRAALAVNVLLGEHEPDEEPIDFEPSEEDEADYREWGEDVDRRWLEQRMERDGGLSDYDAVIATGCAG